MASSENSRDLISARPPEPKRALIYESDALTGERLRRMLAAEGYGTAWVDETRLFDSLRRTGLFELYGVGAMSAEELRRIEDIESLEPLLLVVPLDKRSPINPYRLVHPRASLVDRELRDVDAIRRELARGAAPSGSSSFGGLTGASIQRAFEHFGLSERQLEVLERALRGDTSAEIASRLFISELTVRNHLHAIYERVGVSGRRELLGRFVQGLMEGHA